MSDDHDLPLQGSLTPFNRATGMLARFIFTGKPNSVPLLASLIAASDELLASVRDDQDEDAELLAEAVGLLIEWRKLTPAERESSTLAGEALMMIGPLYA